MDHSPCSIILHVPSALRQLPRELKRRRGHASVYNSLPDNRIILAWVYTTLIVVQKDLRKGDGVPLSLQGCRCDYSDEDVVIACLAGDVAGSLRIGVGQVQLIPSAELPTLIAKSDSTCSLLVLASDDQTVRQQHVRVTT